MLASCWLALQGRSSLRGAGTRAVKGWLVFHLGGELLAVMRPGYQSDYATMQPFTEMNREEVKIPVRVLHNKSTFPVHSIYLTCLVSRHHNTLLVSGRTVPLRTLGQLPGQFIFMINLHLILK